MWRDRKSVCECVCERSVRGGDIKSANIECVSGDNNSMNGEYLDGIIWLVCRWKDKNSVNSNLGSV